MLEVKALNVSYGKQRVLKEVALTLGAGEVVALIGPNAAGKSSTLRTIAGLKRQDSGAIRFRGADIGASPVHERVGAGLVLVPEGRQIFPRLSVRENLLMGAYHRPDRNGTEADIEQVFALFPRLRERSQQRAGSMSGGEQQMVSIGRALMGNPKLMLLDEPSHGLAPIVVEELHAAIAAINRQGVSVLLVEQNAVLALSVAHRGYVLEAGHVVLSGSAQDLQADPGVRRAYLGV